MKINVEHIASHRPYPQWRFLQLTVAIGLWMFIAPLLDRPWAGHIAMQLMLLDMMLVTRSANPRWIRVRHVIVGLWLLSLLASLASIFGFVSHWQTLDRVLVAVFTIPVVVASAVGVCAYAFRTERPTLDGVFAMVVAYLLIATMFSLLQYLTLVLDHDALQLPVPYAQLGPHQLQGNLTYFSLVTITTLGYGDIVPLSSTARLLATMEAMTGQFYIAVVVATFVSMYTTQAIARREEERASRRPSPD
jgi:voltage-gated potassium channel Kch